MEKSKDLRDIISEQIYPLKKQKDLDEIDDDYECLNRSLKIYCGTCWGCPRCDYSH